MYLICTLPTWYMSSKKNYLDRKSYFCWKSTFFSKIRSKKSRFFPKRRFLVKVQMGDQPVKIIYILWSNETKDVLLASWWLNVDYKTRKIDTPFSLFYGHQCKICSWLIVFHQTTFSSQIWRLVRADNFLILFDIFHVIFII